MESVVLEYVEMVPTWAQIVLILSGSFVAAKAIELVGSFVLHRSQRLATHEFDRIIIEELHGPPYVTVFLAGVHTSARLLPEVGIGFYISATAMSIILTLWSHATIRLGGRIIGATNNAPGSREITPILKNVLTFFVIVAGFFSSSASGTSISHRCLPPLGCSGSFSASPPEIRWATSSVVSPCISTKRTSCAI